MRHWVMQLLDLPLFVSFAVLCEFSACSGAELTVKAEHGCSLKVSRDGRAYCEYRSDGETVRVSTICFQKDRPIWQRKLPGELKQFAVNDAVSFGYFVAQNGLFFCEFPAKEEHIISMTPISLPDSFQKGELEVLTVAERSAVIRSHDRLALVSPTNFQEMQRVPKSFFANATARNRTIVYSPGTDCDLQMVIVESDLAKQFPGAKITSFGGPFSCQPFLRVLQANDDLSIVAGIVSSTDGQRCPKGDALFVWWGYSLLDVDRSEEFNTNVALAVYDQDLYAVMRPKNIEESPMLVTWKISPSKGLIRASEKKLTTEDGSSIFQLHPSTPIAIQVSGDAQSMRLFELEDDSQNLERISD